MELAQMRLVSVLQGEIRTQRATRKGDTNMYGDTEGKTASVTEASGEIMSSHTLFTRLLAPAL